MSEKSENRYCVDCRFHAKDWAGIRYSMCRETTNYIEIERSPTYKMHRCGPEGKLWQPKELSFWSKLFRSK